MNEDFSLVKQEVVMQRQEVEHQLKELMRKYNYQRGERTRLEEIVIDLSEDIKKLLQGGDGYKTICGLLDSLTEKMDQFDRGFEDSEAAMGVLKNFMEYLRKLKPSVEKKPKKKRGRDGDSFKTDTGEESESNDPWARGGRG